MIPNNSVFVLNVSPYSKWGLALFASSCLLRYIGLPESPVRALADRLWVNFVEQSECCSVEELLLG